MWPGLVVWGFFNVFGGLCVCVCGFCCGFFCLFSCSKGDWVIICHSGILLYNAERITSCQMRRFAGAKLAGLALEDQRQLNQAQINCSPKFI